MSRAIPLGQWNEPGTLIDTPSGRSQEKRVTIPHGDLGCHFQKKGNWILVWQNTTDVCSIWGSAPSSVCPRRRKYQLSLLLMLMIAPGCRHATCLSYVAGTLTQNEMVFKRLHLGTVAYGLDSMDEVQSHIFSIYTQVKLSVSIPQTAPLRLLARILRYNS